MMYPPLAEGLSAVATGLSVSGMPTAFEKSRSAATILLLRVAANAIEYGPDLAENEARVLRELIYAGTEQSEDGGDGTAHGGGETMDHVSLRRRLVALLAQVPPECRDDFTLLLARSLGKHACERERRLLGP